MNQSLQPATLPLTRPSSPEEQQDNASPEAQPEASRLAFHLPSGSHASLRSAPAVLDGRVLAPVASRTPTPSPPSSVHGDNGSGYDDDDEETACEPSWLMNASLEHLGSPTSSSESHSDDDDDSSIVILAGPPRPHLHVYSTAYTPIANNNPTTAIATTQQQQQQQPPDNLSGRTVSAPRLSGTTVNSRNPPPDQNQEGEDEEEEEEDRGRWAGMCGVLTMLFDFYAEFVRMKGGPGGV